MNKDELTKGLRVLVEQAERSEDREVQKASRSINAVILLLQFDREGLIAVLEALTGYLRLSKDRRVQEASRHIDVVAAALRNERPPQGKLWIEEPRRRVCRQPRKAVSPKQHHKTLTVSAEKSTIA